MKFDKEIIFKRKKYPIFLFFIILTTWFVFVDLVDGDWNSLENSLDNLSVFFYESLWPPNWKVLEARSYPVCDRNWDFLCSPAYIGIVETLKIAFVSTGLGFILSLPPFRCNVNTAAISDASGKLHMGNGWAPKCPLACLNARRAPK